jgi:hypothetical protein
VRPLVIVILDPELSSLDRLLEAVELGPLEELAQDRLPEAFDLAQRHRMVGTRTDMLDAILLHLPFEAGLTAPVRVLSAVVGKHLFGNAVLGNAAAVGLQHVFGGLTAVQPQGGDVAAVVVHKADQVGVAPASRKVMISLCHIWLGRARSKKRGLGGFLTGLRFALFTNPFSDKVL